MSIVKNVRAIAGNRFVRLTISSVIKFGFVTAAFVFIFRPETFGARADLFQDITIGSLIDTIREIRPLDAAVWFTFAAVIKLVGIFCGILRWRLLLKGQGIHIPFWYLTKCWFMGRAIGLFLPGTIGLDGYRLVESARYTGEVIECTTVIAVEKLTGFIALFTLVFLTIPLGMRLFEFNMVMLAGVLGFLFVFISCSLLLLLKPRVIQVLTHVVPAPEFVRSKIHRLGIAATAYHGNARLLLGALFLGLMVHLAICMVFFGTASAIRAENTSILDIMFAAPLFIVASVLTPTVSGMGVRELVMGTLLGGQAGTAKAVTFGHMEFWFGEIVPFILSVPLLLFTTRPKRDQLLEDVAKARRAAAAMERQALHFTPDELAFYKDRIYKCVLAGLCAGLVGGALVGLVEAGWHASITENLTDLAAFWWAPLVYGLVFSGVGLGAVAVLVFLYLLFNKFAPTAVTFGLAFGGTLAAAALVIGRFRYVRDVLEEAAPTMQQNLDVLGAVAAVGIAGAVLGSIIVALGSRGGSWRRAISAAVAVYLVCIVGGGIYATANAPERVVPAFTDVPQTNRPNIILVAVDTLRADFLPMYQPETAPARTPNLAAFTKDAVLFQNAFAQSSWTKASFGTIFSGMYPTAHSATSKASALPDEVETFPEVLNAGGYYTKGYSNNPNITSTFNYDQGFVDYVDLKPNLYFGARPSCEKLVVYDILRKVVNIFYARAPFVKGRIVITDFYQPAEVVTNHALEWIDGAERPKEAPFFLFLHYMDPHDPFRDPDRPGKGYARVQMGDPDPEVYRDVFRKAYTYEIEYMDTHVGRLFDGLRERGLYDDTLIIFTSDHGEEFCEHGGWWHGLSLYEEQIAIPLIMKLPQAPVKGKVNPALARHIDLAPTLLKIAGLQATEKMVGIPLFTDDFQPGNGAISDSYAELDFEGIELQSIRTKETKLIKSNENKRKFAPVELYDLAVDPGELSNLAGSNATLEQQLLALVDSALERAAADAVAAQSGDLDAVREQLDAIGYLGDDDTDDD